MFFTFLEYSKYKSLLQKANKLELLDNTKPLDEDDIIALAIGDSYTEGELMTRFKNNGYSCK